MYVACELSQSHHLFKFNIQCVRALILKCQVKLRHLPTRMIYQTIVQYYEGLRRSIKRVLYWSRHVTSRLVTVLRTHMYTVIFTFTNPICIATVIVISHSKYNLITVV